MHVYTDIHRRQEMTVRPCPTGNHSTSTSATCVTSTWPCEAAGKVKGGPFTRDEHQLTHCGEDVVAAIPSRAIIIAANTYSAFIQRGHKTQLF